MPLFEADLQFMREALKEAQKAYVAGEVPVGAVLVIDGQIIARAYNQVELLNDSTAHAEMLALTAAFHAMGSKYLPQATLYVTLEPCLMCTGALYWSQIGRGASPAPMRKTVIAFTRNACIPFILKPRYREDYWLKRAHVC